jgi:hypothetical protein
MLGAMTEVVRNMADIVEVFRARIRQLGVTYETVDEIAGLPDRYTAKLMTVPAMKRPGPIAIQAICGALAIKFIPAVDEDQVPRVRDRWTPRKRPHSIASVKTASKSDAP